VSALTGETTESTTPTSKLTTPNLTKLKDIQRTFNKRVLASYVGIFGGLGLVTFAIWKLEGDAGAWVSNAGFLIALLATLWVGLAMVLEASATHKIQLNWQDGSVAAALLSKKLTYKELSNTVILWRTAFHVMFWVAFATFVILGIVVFASRASPGVIFLALLLLLPTFLARRYSEELMKLWSPDVLKIKTLDPLDYVKGTTSGREVFGYWLAFIGLVTINQVAGETPVFPSNMVTPVLVLLSIGSTAKMLGTGHKEFCEARDTIVRKANTDEESTKA
jgi:hypothetical protein